MIDRTAFKLLAMAIGFVLVGAVLLLWSTRHEVPDFSQYAAGPERKGEFFGYFLPLVQQRYQEILQTRQQLQVWSQNPQGMGWWASRTVNNLAEDYRIENFDIDSEADWNTLLRRVDVVPVSLALVQAAKESAWGTSRFVREGRNYFGQWCFEPGCGMVPGNRDQGKSHEVAVFDSPRESVHGYMRNLNSHYAYKPLRELRARLRAQGKPVTGLALTAGLEKYSERGADYVAEISAMIRHNDLSRFDQ